jgi:hypothetical protein
MEDLRSKPNLIERNPLVCGVGLFDVAGSENDRGHARSREEIRVGRVGARQAVAQQSPTVSSRRNKVFPAISRLREVFIFASISVIIRRS